MTTDQSLMHAIKNGDQVALNTLVHRYHKSVYAFVERLLHNRDKSEDIVQEAFLKLLYRLRDRVPPDHVQAWLYRVARNLCRDYWKSARYRKENAHPDHALEQRDRYPQVVDICVRRETRIEIVMLLDELPEPQREIVMLRFYQELKLHEIANVMACPLGTVKSRLYHALRFLKGRIEERGNVSHG